MRIISGILDLDGLLAVSEAWRIARAGDLRGGIRENHWLRCHTRSSSNAVQAQQKRVDEGAQIEGREKMIEIDGSFGEGGGQIIRTAVALSAITGEEVEIYNIRANRPNPGLQAQHLNAVKTVAEMTNANVEGLKLRSKRLRFSPGSPKALKTDIDIGTAGSITLLLQCVVPVALFANGTTELTVRGGTDVRWSPPIDFYRFLFVRAISEMGCDVEISLIKRGYYPRGGGVVRVRVKPVRKLSGFFMMEETVNDVRGISHCRGLPAHVASRQANSAREILSEHGYRTDILVETSDENGGGLSESDGYGSGSVDRSVRGMSRSRKRKSKEGAGSGITLWRNYKSGSALGEPGKPAEEVGRDAAFSLLRELESESTVDVHLADQLIPYIALSDEHSAFKVREITGHLRTNIYIVEKFLQKKISIKKEESFIIECCD